MTEVEVHVAGKQLAVRQGPETMFTRSVAEAMIEVACALDRPPACGVLPDGVRVWRERGDAVAVAVEVPPHARTVRWLTDDSPASFGRGARYGRFYLAFPYVVLLLVFRRGALTGQQQLYYRRAPLVDGEDLLLPAAYNVAAGYGLKCWLCLASMSDVAPLSWSAKVRSVVDHTLTAAWNKSSDEHEGNSLYSTLRRLDPRIATPHAWEEATRRNPRFVLDIEWPAANTTVAAELGAMLDRVVTPARVATASDLAGLLARTGRGGRR